ncbi:MAG: CAP domain-containing protein [Leptolyngbyaceae cyanobacterium SL_7_1]|nr:CAP domain-containing protein [Leptolyngbyaceae cyanobacterium SL_7_1]
MASNPNSIHLRPDQSITLTASAFSHTGQLTTKNRDRIYKFKLNRSSDLTIRLDGLGHRSTLELIQDRNRNGQLNAGEVIARTHSRSGTLGKIIRSDLQPGVFFLRVSLAQGKIANYSLQPALQTQLTQPTGSTFEDQVLQLTNTFRQQQGLKPLRYNLKLAAAAELHSQNMALQDFFSHTSMDGASPFDRMRGAGYNYSYAAENIAVGYTTPEAVMQGWINSPSHKVNLLNPNLRELGVGYYHLPTDTGKLNYYHYWTQNFGSPA